MSILTSLFLISLWIVRISGLKQLPARTASFSYNETSTKSEAATTTSSVVELECCYLSSFEVGKILWYSESINITVAKVSTIVYKYENTAITSIQTSSTNSLVPSKAITRSSIYSLHTTIIGSDLGVFEAETTFIHGTAFTDPYGKVYESPTPVWVYTNVIYATASPTSEDSTYACPNSSDVRNSSGKEISPYPSGFFLADDDSNYGWNSPGVFATTLPAQLHDWMAADASSRANTFTNVGQCKLGVGKGVPTAYIPYNQITATITRTSIMVGNYGTNTVLSPDRKMKGDSTSIPSTTLIKAKTAYTTQPTHPTTAVSVTKIYDALSFAQTPAMTTLKAALISTSTSTIVSTAVIFQTPSTTIPTTFVPQNLSTTIPTTFVPQNSSTISTSFTSQAPIPASNLTSTPSSPSFNQITTSEDITTRNPATDMSMSTKTILRGPVTTEVNGGGLGKIVVVIDWASPSMDNTQGVGQQSGRGTGTVPALADKTVVGVAQSPMDSGSVRGMRMGVGSWEWCGLVLGLGFVGGIWGV